MCLAATTAKWLIRQTRVMPGLVPASLPFSEPASKLRDSLDSAGAMIQAILVIVTLLAGTSLLVGGLVALAVVIWAVDTASALYLIGYGHAMLAALMPVALWLGIYITHNNAEYAAAYKSRLRALATTLQATLVGSILGAGPLFITLVIQLPVSLADFDPAEFGAAVRDVIVWSHLLVAVAAALLSAFPLGFWAFYAAGD